MSNSMLDLTTHAKQAYTKILAEHRSRCREYKRGGRCSACKRFEGYAADGNLYDPVHGFGHREANDE